MRMAPPIALAKPIPGGYSVEGIETVNFVTANLPAMTKDGTPVLLAPKTHDMVLNLENRADQILGLWIEQIKKVRETILDQAEAAANSEDRLEKAAHLLALSNLSDEAWTEVFKAVANQAAGLYTAAYGQYKALERETMIADGWKPGDQSGPLTETIRGFVEVMTGETLSDSQIKEHLDKSNCGDPNCQVHGHLNTESGIRPSSPVAMAPRRSRMRKWHPGVPE